MTHPKTTIERVRAIIMENGGNDAIGSGAVRDTVGDDQPLFYVAARQTHGEATAAGCVGLDSLDRVEVVMAIEEEFDLEISDADVIDNNESSREGWNTITGIASYIDERIAAAARV